MRFLSKREVSQKIGLSRTEIDRKEAAGKFPKRVQVGFRVFWVESEVEGWMERLIANRDHASPDRVRENITDPPDERAGD
jgi:prophage regulatory protein